MKYTVFYVPESEGGPKRKIEANSPIEAANMFAIENPQNRTILVSSANRKQWIFSIKELADKFPDSRNYYLLHCSKAMMHVDAPPERKVEVNWTFLRPGIVLIGILVIASLVILITLLIPHIKGLLGE